MKYKHFKQALLFKVGSVNNFNGLKEKFTYKLADNGDLQVKSKSGSASITFLNDGLYRGDDYFKRIYAPSYYKGCKKYL